MAIEPAFEQKFLDGLRFTFRYWTGLRSATLETFDIREEICLEVGGFRHGDVVEDPDGDRYVVVGVTLEEAPEPGSYRPANQDPIESKADQK